ncbi:MAG: major capsid protein [Paludibacteraceae bacterium]|nr:major capsid protein [Paludibacteraceae bacterium]
MKLSDVFTAEAIALNYTNAASNKIPYLGTGFFPAQKKAGLDLKWIKGHNGLAVSLMPSAFDAKSTFRDRVGVSVNETQMPFFRESMLVKEADEQEIMRVRDASDPYAVQVLDNIFNDTQTLIDGANVVPERMIMQLLAPLNGKMGIEIAANGVNYVYNYDVDGSWKAEHYAKIETEADKWTAEDTCDPLKNIEDAMDAQEEATGARPEILLMSKTTFNYIKNSKRVRSGLLAQNTTANVNYTSAKVKAFVEEELDVQIIVYNKQFKDETGVAKKFYPDNIVMMLPKGDLGKTWYGTTPEERTLAQKEGADVSVVNTGVAIAVTITDDPVNTKTTCSEIVLPSFERMNECYALEVC